MLRFTNFRITLIFVLLCLCISTVVAQNKIVFDGNRLFDRVEEKSSTSDKLQAGTPLRITTLTTLNLNKTNCDYVFKNSGENITINNFPINTLDLGTVVLKRVKSAMDAETQWMRQTKNGITRGTKPELMCYSGTIENESNTKLFINYCGGKLFAYIRSTDGHQYDLVSTYDKSNTNSTKLTISEQNYNLLDKPDVNPFECLTEDAVLETTEQADLFKIGNELQADDKKLYEVRIGIDAINNFFRLMGSDYNNTVNYIAAVMSHVSYLYEENFNIRLYVPYVLVREIQEEDPYEIYELNDFQTKLENMAWIWSGRFNDRPDKVALISMFAALSGQGGSNVAGLSYCGVPGKGVLCDRTYGFGIFGLQGYYQYPNYNYTWDVNVVAHELGHNFGLQHTHSCYYEPNMIDTCVTQTLPFPIGDACVYGQNVPRPGTLMSYCHLSNSTHSVDLAFHPREIPLVRAAVKRADCLMDMKTPYVDILSPLVKNVYTAGDTINIRWTSIKINKVDIYYSIDNGANWVNIVSSVPAADSIYHWTAPSIETNNMNFKIVDNSDASYFDISDSKITIITPKISFITPTNKAEYSNKEKMNVVWEANLSKKFDLYFSSDNGTSWTNLTENFGSKEYSFDLPEITSENCQVKVIDHQNNEVIALSPVFAVGTAYLSLFDPREGEILCAGRKYNITWASKYLNKFVIEYSTNNGVNWKKSSIGAIDASEKVFNWNIPNITSDSVLIRASLYDDQDDVLFTADHYFAIDTCGASVQDNINSYKLFEITGVNPNPVNKIAELEIMNNAFEQSAEISLINVSGQTVWKKSVDKLIFGENIWHFDFSSVQSGKYWVILKNANYSASYPINIVR